MLCLRLRLSSLDNVPGWILSLVYLIAAWWAQAYEDVGDFRASQKHVLTQKIRCYSCQPLMKISIV